MGVDGEEGVEAGVDVIGGWGMGSQSTGVWKS